jgi:hypothetical protein
LYISSTQNNLIYLRFAGTVMTKIGQSGATS